jgi:hypothetical protein
LGLRYCPIDRFIIVCNKYLATASSSNIVAIAIVIVIVIAISVCTLIDCYNVLFTTTSAKHYNHNRCFNSTNSQS